MRAFLAVLTSNPIIGTRDGAQHVSQLKGTTADLGNDLARRAGVPARMIEYTAIPKLMEDASAGVGDVAVVAIDPGRVARGRAAGRGEGRAVGLRDT